MKNKALIVLGMHRSGTSALAGVLAMAGADPGRFLIQAQEGVNPKGFWEHSDIVSIHEKVLSELGATWDNEQAFPDDWWKQDRIVQLRQEIIATLKRDFSNSPLWVLKDPRLCRLLPMWIGIFQEIGTDPHFILCLRHPMEVAASLKLRDNIELERACLMWLVHLSESERWTQQYPRIIVSYDELLEDWHTTVQRIADEFSLSLPISDIASNAIDDFLDLGLRHHRPQIKNDLEHDGFASISQEVYKTAITEKPDRLTKKLEIIADEIKKTTKFIAPWSSEISAIRNKLSEFNYVVAENEELKRKLCISKKEIDRIKNSFSWKITKPLRAIMNFPRLISYRNRKISR